MSSDIRKQHRKILKRANAAVARKDLVEAEKCFREYLPFAPDDPMALFNLGSIAHQKLKKEKAPQKAHLAAVEAMDFYGKSVLSPEVDMETKANALNNTGLILQQLGYPEKAKISFHLALQVFPDHKAAKINFADILAFEGDYDEADKQFFEIMNSEPGSAGPLFSRSMICLLMGDLKRGFMEYRSRYNVPSFISKMMDTDKPLWDGEPLNGKTLVIQQEQGWGDAIQFIRYAEEVKKAYPDCKVIYRGQVYMHSLMSSVRGVDECVDSEPPEPFTFQHDYHIPLMHLPYVFGTTLETVPANMPYILPRDDWKPIEVPKSEKKRKIALVWAGSPMHGKDKFRSMTTEQFQRFIDAAPNSQFYALQCGPRQHEATKLTNCIDLAPLIIDWTQTTKAVSEMDLVIAVDTAVAHLAGALDVPCWILLNSSPDFRWMLTRTDSPWYPKATLFRQEVKGEWELPMQKIEERLKALDAFA